MKKDIKTIELAEFFDERGGIHKLLHIFDIVSTLRSKLLQIEDYEERCRLSQEISKYIEFVAQFEEPEDDEE